MASHPFTKIYRYAHTLGLIVDAIHVYVALLPAQIPTRAQEESDDIETVPWLMMLTIVLHTNFKTIYFSILLQLVML